MFKQMFHLLSLICGILFYAAWRGILANVLPIFTGLARAKFRPSFRPMLPWMAKKSPLSSHLHGEKAKSRQVVVVVFVAQCGAVV
jgi:hypothetical protein